MPKDFVADLTSSSETLTPDEARLVSQFFTNSDRSIVALKNLPEVIKGALFSRYSRSAKGVRRLFLDEFLVRRDLGIEEFSRGAGDLSGQITQGEERAEDFYRRILSDYGDDSVGELGGAHLACQEISQIAAKAIEHGRIGISYLEKSSRYVPFDDRVDGKYRYYRPRRILESRFGTEYIQTLDLLFDSYARNLPPMIEHLSRENPIHSIEFENALTGDVVRYSEIRDDDFRKSADFAYRQSVKARACDMLRCFLPMATLTNVGVWGNGRALEYMLVRLYSDPLDEIQSIARAAHHELEAVIGPFLKRANDDKGKASQALLRDTNRRQRELAGRWLGEAECRSQKVTLVNFDADALDRVAAAILFAGSSWGKAEIVNRVRGLSTTEKSRIICDYVGERKNRRHKPGRAFEHARYEFDLLLNIGEYRDLQRHRMVTSDRQSFSTSHGYTVNDDIAQVPEIRDDYERGMARASKLYDALVQALPNEAQYAVPFGYRVRYNVQMNLREAYHWLELRSAPQGHPDYRHTCQEMFRAIQTVHPILVEPMKFVDMTPDVPLGRLRAEMRRARKGLSREQSLGLASSSP
jgi:thymidylate synthase ThyX